MEKMCKEMVKDNVTEVALRN